MIEELICPTEFADGTYCLNRLCKIGVGRFKCDIEIKCRKCGRLVVYKKDTGLITTKKVPPRTQSSGLRFY